MVTDLFSDVISERGESEALEDVDGNDAPESEGENEDLVGESGENEWF